MVFELPRDYPKPPPPGEDLSTNDTVEVQLAKMASIAPQPLNYEYVGELYAKILDGFRSIPEDKLFVGPKSSQSGNDWSDSSLDMRVVTNQEEAIAAIDNIIVDGEGIPTNRESSHFQKFKLIRQEYFDLGRFKASREVPLNPATRIERKGNGEVTLIKNSTSLKIAELFNSGYSLTLLLLQEYFSSAPAPDDALGIERRRAFQQASQRLMSTFIRPLAEILTEQPLDRQQDLERAAPCFEIYSNIELSPYPVGRWTYLLERFQMLIDECNSFRGLFPRISEMGENLLFMSKDIKETLKGVVV